MDTARQHLDVEIERTESTRLMLTHLADAVEHSTPDQKGGETYKHDAREALLHGAELAAKDKRNLKHVARLYDAKVEKVVDDPG